MSKYSFETAEFGLSQIGVHLLRSRFNYKTLEYKEIELLEITKGKTINNWMLVLLIGIGLILFSIVYTVSLVQVLNDPTVHTIYIEQIITPVIPLFLGGSCVYTSSKTGTVLKLKKQER